MQIRSGIPFQDNRFLMFVLDEMAYHYEKNFNDVIRLTLGKSELPVCGAISDAMQSALADFQKSSLVFPAGLPALKERIAQHYHEAYQCVIDPRNVIISVGTSAAFRNLFQLLLSPEDEVLLRLPYYH